MEANKTTTEKITFEQYLKEHPYQLTSSFTKSDWEDSMFEQWLELTTPPAPVKETEAVVKDNDGKVLDGFENMPKWNRDYYSSWHDWAKSCYKAGKKDTDNELVRALEMVLWDMENGEAEAQKQGKPRYSQRKEIIKNLLSRINK